MTPEPKKCQGCTDRLCDTGCPFEQDEEQKEANERYAENHRQMIDPATGAPRMDWPRSAFCTEYDHRFRGDKVKGWNCSEETCGWCGQC